MALDDDLDALYAAPLEEFTSARNDLAERLRDAGNAAAATRVKKLQKPNLAAWAINQLARRHPDDVAAALAIRDRLEQADGPQELRELSKERRVVVGRLKATAEQILESEGHSAGAATLDRISQTFLSSGSDEDRDTILQGRLSREVVSSGLEAFGVESLAAAEAAPSKPSAKARREVDRLVKEADDAEAEAQRLTEEAKRLEEEARAAMEAAADARRAAIKIRDRARRAERDL